MPNSTLTFPQILGRIAIYLVLTLFAFVMIFPFLYMIMTSLKTTDDVFRYPPELLPLSSETITFNDEQVALYTFVIDGEEVQLVPSGEKLPHFFFTTPELINADDKRSSEIVVAIPREQVEAGGVAVATGNEVEFTAMDGDVEAFDEYEVRLDGETVTLLEAYRGSMDEFVNPSNPAEIVYEFERNAQAVEFVEFQFDNYNNVLELDLDRAFINTTLVTFGVVAGQLITSIFGGYAFSRVQFKGRDTLFLIYLGSIMVPFVVLIIPMYRLMVILEWQNQLVSLIVPWVFTAYGTFLMRQFFISIPKEIEEAALLDGASRFRILWGIFVPLSRPAIATLAIFSFLYAWNSFLWPLLIIGEGNESNHVLTLALIRLSNSFADQPNIVLTGAAIAILPPVIIFVFAQRYFIEGVATSGLKG